MHFIDCLFFKLSSAVRKRTMLERNSFKFNQMEKMCSLPFLKLTPEAEWIINNGERSFSTAENSIKMSCYARHFVLILNEHSVEQIFRLVWERDLSVLLILSLLLTPRKSRNCQTKYSVMGLRKENSIKIMYENSFIKSYLKAVNIF